MLIARSSQSRVPSEGPGRPVGTLLWHSEFRVGCAQRTSLALWHPSSISLRIHSVMYLKARGLKCAKSRVPRRVPNE